VEILDNGSGMDEDTLKKSLTPFFIFTSKPDKKGLGLTIASNIIKTHGGRLEIKSTRGKGTGVRISFKI